MKLSLLTFVTSLAIASVAAWYSIIGLTAIFSAAVIPIIIMGIVLEIGKLVAASWVYTYWKETAKLLRAYLVSAVVILMLITSMGIYGFLSKSHIDAGTNTSQVTVKLDRVNSRIASEQKVIDRAERQLENLDKALERYVELGAVSKGLDRRESQEEERLKLTNMVNKSQDKIDEYLDQKSEYELEIKNFEVEVGPLKYISALLYGDDALTFLENAVRWVILILVFVFDPLAVLLVVAANITIRDVLNKRKRIKDKLLRKQRKNKILVKEEPIGDGTARKITKTKNGVTMEYYE